MANAAGQVLDAVQFGVDHVGHVMTHSEIKEYLSLYVLGTLEGDESREVELHLAAGCGECEHELADWREIVARLGPADEDPKGPELRARLLDRIETKSPQHTRVRRRGWRVGLPLAVFLALAVAGLLRDLQWRSRVDDQARRTQRVIAELAHSRDLAGDLREQLTAGQATIDDLAAQLAAKEKDLAQLRVALAATQESLGVLQTPGLRLVRLRQTRDAKPAEGHALLNSERGRAVFYAFDLPPVAADKTYELWWITAKKGPINAGLFRPDERGLGRIEADLPKDAGAITATAVTIEPAAGVEKPTGPTVLHGEVKRG